VKGIELPINILVIVAIAVIVLLGMVALYFAGWSPFSGSLSIQAAKNAACEDLVRNGCKSTTDVPVQFDVNADGEVGGTGDNLQLLCEKYYGVVPEDDPTDPNPTAVADCRDVCGCPMTA
jgi:hypothetical protein